MKTAKKVLALLLSVLMVFTMVSSSVVAVAETTPTEKAEIENVGNKVTNAFDSVKGIVDGVHNLVGGILSMLGKECVFCDEIHGKTEDTEEPTEPETPPSEPEVPVEPEEPTEPETPVEPEEPTEPEEPKEDEPTEDKIDNAFDSIGGIFDSIHNLVGNILAIFGKECPFCDKVHGEEDVEEDKEDETDEPEIIDTDKDGISDEEETIYGTDANKADTDDDGYTDFEELFLMGTDPLKANEKDVDTDGDGLSDYDEVKKYGTDINSEDTDGDGLTDYDEVNRYNTDPTKKDTDGDGLSDAFEIENGLDPLKACTDGKNNDADVKIEQTTGDESVSDALLGEENIAKPSLEGKVAGDLSEKVFIGTSPDCSLDDNRAVIGEPIVIDGDEDYVDDLKLKFDLSSYEGVLENLSICKLDEDGNIVPVESELEGLSISCGAEADATYFVMDIDAFLKALGIDLDAYKAMTFSLRGRSAEVAGDKVSGQADIVFAIDTTGSMSGTIYNVIANVKDFTERLATEYSVKVNYALIDYRDLEEDGPGTTKVIKNGTSNWFSNIDTYGSALNTLYADGGGDGPECSVDALETARLLDFRKSANKFVVLITDADYKVLNDYGIKSMDEVAEKLAADGINTSVVCPTYYKSLYENVYSSTGGIFADIYGNFSAELLKLADLIGEETSDGEWVILKHGYRYVKLPAIPTADSTVDTDEDGISDYKELGKSMTIDLTPFITFQLLAYGVPFEAYLGKTSITVYDSIADPTLYDTDGDGICDLDDSTPWKKGLENGVIGELYLVTCYGKSFSSGHAFFVYKSFIEDSIDFSGLVNGWQRVDRTMSWSSGNLERDLVPTDSYYISPNEYVCIGNGANGAGPFSGASDGSGDGSSAGEYNGVNYNMETWKFLLAGKPTGTIDEGVGFSYLENVYISEKITATTLEKLISYLSREDVNYWSLHHNCAEVAADGWNYVASTKISAYGLEGWSIYPTPSAIRDNIKKLDTYKTNFKMTEAFK